MNRRVTPIQMRDLLQRTAAALIGGGVLVSDAMEAFHRCLLEEALLEHDNNQVHTAKAQGMHRNTMRRQLTGLGLLMPDRRPLARKPIPERFPASAPVSRFEKEEN